MSIQRTVKIETNSSDNTNYKKYKLEKNKTENVKGIKARGIVFSTDISEDNPDFRMTLIGFDGMPKASYSSFHNFDKIFSKIDEMYKRNLEEKLPVGITEKKRRDKVDKGSYSLYSNDTGAETDYGYCCAEKARQTLRQLKGKDKSYTVRVVNTMLNRAKNHPHQTAHMRQAISVYKNWLKNN